MYLVKGAVALRAVTEHLVNYLLNN